MGGKLNHLILAVVFFLCLGGLWAEEISQEEPGGSLTPIVLEAQEDGARGLFREAEEAASRGKYAKAAKYYKRLAEQQRNPSLAAACVHRQAELLVQAGKAFHAKVAFEKLLEGYPFQIQLERVLEQLRALADDFEQGRGTTFHLRDPRAAIAIYRLIIKHQPSIERSLEDRMVLAKKLELEKMWEDAVALYQETIKKAPKDPDCRFQLAKVLHYLARHDGDSDGERSKAAIRQAESFLQLAREKDFRREQAKTLIAECREDEGARMLERAKFYLGKYHFRPQVARRYLHDILRQLPQTAAAREATDILKENFPEETGSVPDDTAEKGEAK